MNEILATPVLRPCRPRKCIHRVVIYKEGCSFRVEPGRLVVHPGAVVNFVSLVRSATVDLWFPKGMVAKTPEPFGWLGSATVQIVSGYDVFVYSVHVLGADGGELAEGGSPPRIIVADP